MKTAACTTPAVLVCILVIFFGFSPPLRADGDPNDPGRRIVCSAIPMNIDTVPGSCWKNVFSRNGSDGGQLTVDINGCEVVESIHYPMPQGRGYGVIADLEPDDVFIVWDEDTGHGEDENDNGTLYFEFTGDYVKVNPDDIYIRLSTTDSRTEWTVFLVTSPGTLTKTGDCCNEHDAIHVRRYLSSFIKEDDIPDANCVVPGDDISYSICWDNLNGFLIEDAWLIDRLPGGVDFVSANPEGEYDPDTHSYVWPLGDIDPNTMGCVELNVRVNTDAVSGYILQNVAELIVDGTVIERDTEHTDVCCWAPEPDLIYVDQSAVNGANTGMSWEDAYLELTDALERARNSLCVNDFIIYAAPGTYIPGVRSDSTFYLPDGCKVYGGFPTGGCAFNKRNPKQFETILSGRIDEDTQVDMVVTMGQNTLLNGCTVTGASFDGSGIYGSGVDFGIENCMIINNDNTGIRGIEGNVTVKWCEVKNNGFYAIFHQGEGKILTVENSQIRKNNEYGIFCVDSTPVIKNSIVSENDLVGAGSEGIFIANPTYSPTLLNNTFAYNRAEGIFFTDSLNDPNNPDSKDWPDVTNCILYHNNLEANKPEQFSGFSKSCISYSCVYDPNDDPNGTSLVKDANYNFSTNPAFAYSYGLTEILDPNNASNVHIAYVSPCRDAGNPNLLYTRQVDMDQQARLEGATVDVGADEVVCGDVFNERDWNTDGLVNFEEFTVFQRAWLSYDPNHPLCDPNHPNYVDDPNAPGYISEGNKLRFNAKCDLVEDLTIDLLDITEFIAGTPWLWQACWRSTDCFDSFNILDYDHDGLVNMVEFSLFAKYWQTYQPTNPDWEFCNLDDTGDSQYTIDMADLMIFMEDWLWAACWRDDLPVPVEQQAAAQDPNEQLSNLEQALQLNENICYLTDIWQSDPNMQQEIAPDSWQEFMDILCVELNNLISSLSEVELTVYNMLAGENCCVAQMAMSVDGGESRLASTETMSVSLESQSLPVPRSIAEKATLSEQIEAASQLVQLEKCAEYLETLWLEDPTIRQEIDPKSWQDFMDAMYEELDRIYQ